MLLQARAAAEHNESCELPQRAALSRGEDEACKRVATSCAGSG